MMATSRIPLAASQSETYHHRGTRYVFGSMEEHRCTVDAMPKGARMRIFRVDTSRVHVITEFGSQNVTISGIVRTQQPLQIGRMEFAPGGLCGYHQADPAQLFLVVEGSGWVRGASDERHAIAAGQAAFWEAGEYHESGSETGMVAMVIEGEVLDPAQFLREEEA
jgi:quercetin dioxygenase-like cupin family protein